jgi:AraC family transcriptional activator of pobA
MPKKVSIPLHYLTEEARSGLLVHQIDGVDKEEIARLGAHRDDHCNFFFQESGSGRLMVDFREVRLEGRGVFCIMPGQVHYPMHVENMSGWFVATDMSALDEYIRTVVEEFAEGGYPVRISDEQSDMLSKSLQLLNDLFRSPEDNNKVILQSMLKVCLGIFASIFESEINKNSCGHLRPSIITSAFKKALKKYFKTVKSPSEYAAILNITSSYLNEVVKETTGRPVSYWIHKEVMMESKRLLYHTNLSVKEIAFSMGYEDHAYFSRLFRKITGKTPGQFRDEYRE